MKKNFSLILAVIFFFFSLIAYCQIDSSFISFIQSNLILDNDSKESYKGWQKPPIDIFFRVYFFNITNPEGVLERKEPFKLNQLGPYTYKETREKVNVTINNEDGTISYSEKKSWQYMPELSHGNLNDSIYHINVPMLSEYNEIIRLGGEEMMLEYLAALVKQENVKLILKDKISELMFDGYPDKLLESAAEIGLKVPDKFGFFYERNNSVTKEFKIRNGVNDLSMYGRVVSYDGLEKLNYWKSESCNKIDHSTTGDLNPPFQSPIPSTIKLFIHDLCRTMSLRFNGTSKHERITTNRYILPNYAFNYEIDPENQCYCLNNECPESGIFENSVCTQNSTASVSFPHFMYGHHKYFKHIKGLEPNPDLHSFYLDIDPLLAIVESLSEDDKEVSIANEIWILDDCLLWPPKNLIKLPQRKLLSSVPDEKWSRIEEFTILQRGIESIEEANTRLNFYCSYDDTLDQIQSDAAKAQQRLHPIQYLENHLDYNSLFDDIKTKKGSTSTPNSSLEVTQKQENAKSKFSCNLCGSLAGIIKCSVCNPNGFCESCDTLYHKHPLRQKHLRQKMKVSSSHHRQAQTKKVASAKSATVTKTVNASEIVSSEQIENNNSQVLPMPPKQKHSNIPGNSSYVKRKINENDGVEINDSVLKRELELQALSGDSNDIPEDNAGISKRQAINISHKKPKVIRTVKSHLSLFPPASGNNKAESTDYILDTAAHGDNKAINKNQKLPVKKPDRPGPPIAPAPGNNAENTDYLPVTAGSGHNKAENSDRQLLAAAAGCNIQQKIQTIEITTICVMCGSAGAIKCDQCSSMILCVTCDNRYHQHVLRIHHKRQKMEVILTKDIEDKIQRKTENNAKLETETNATASAESHIGLAEPSNQVNRPPPPLILMTRKSIVSKGAPDLDQNSESKEESDDNFDFSFEDNLPSPELNQAKINETVDPLLEIDHVASDLESYKNENLDKGEMNNNETKTTTSKIQKKEENPRQQRNVRRRRIAISKAHNPFNKQMLSKMFLAIKAIKKNQGTMMVAMNNLKRQQVGLKNKMNHANAEIQVIKELINNNIQTPKNEIMIDNNFIVPKMRMGSVGSIAALEKNCKNSTYCDQLAVRFKKYTASIIKDIKPAIKRIMEILFLYEAIMLYSWTGKSELNSGTDQKLKFSCLTGIQSMIAKAATLNLPSTPSIDNMCTAGIKDVVRRASQNWSRQNR